MQKTPEEIVSAFVKDHAIVDKHLAAAYKAALRMAKNVDEGIKIGMVTQIAAKQFQSKHRAAAGEIASVAAVFADLHVIGTEHAKANGVDLGSMTSVGGVSLPPQPKSGGR